GVAGVVNQRLGANRNVVPEQRRNLVGMAGAPDVPEERHPVGGLADVVGELSLLAHPRREQARPKLRLQRLAERIVLCEGQRGDELCEAQRRVQDRAYSRCLSVTAGRGSSHTRGAAAGRERRPATAPPKGDDMADSTADDAAQPIRVGVLADQTGPLSIIGLANANVARMVIGDINAKGGLLGRQLELQLEDSATDDAVAAERATKLLQVDQVDVVFGGIYSSTRQARQ